VVRPAHYFLLAIMLLPEVAISHTLVFVRSRKLAGGITILRIGQTLPTTEPVAVYAVEQIFTALFDRHCKL
jgi:hypothetical protein